MTLFTHLLLSGYVYQKIPKESGVKRLPFMLGSIRPDLAPDFLRIPHTLPGSGQNTIALYNELLSGLERSAQFSQNLGVLCHYLSDYFCSSHQSEEQYNNLLSHFIHERILFVKMFWMMLTCQKPSDSKERRPSAFLDEMIDSMLSEYRFVEETVRKDLDFAFQSSLWVCRSALYYSIYPKATQNAGQLVKSVL